MQTDWLNEERLECRHAYTLFTGEREREKEKGREKESERERERERESEKEGVRDKGGGREGERCNNGSFIRNDGCLGTF